MPNPRGGLAPQRRRWATRPPPPTSCPAAAGWSPPRPTTTASPRCSPAAASSTASGCSAPRTVAYMARNHLPGGADLETFGRPVFAESAIRGVGFGLGVSVVVDAAAGKVLTSLGEFAWGGLASTAFYVDPAEEVTAMFFTQLLPSSTYPDPLPAAHAGQPGAGGLMPIASPRHPGGRDRGQPVGGHADRARHRHHGGHAPPSGIGTLIGVGADLRAGQRRAQAADQGGRLPVLRADARPDRAGGERAAVPAGRLDRRRARAAVHGRRVRRGVPRARSWWRWSGSCCTSSIPDRLDRAEPTGV